MGFWHSLVAHLWAARTPFVFLAFILARFILRYAPDVVPRQHLRAAAILIFGHLVTVIIQAVQIASGYDGEILGLTALAFQLLAYVSLGVTVIFRAILPRAGFVLPRILIDLFTGAGVLVCFIVVGNRAGFSIAGLITTSAVLTAVIGFSLQDTLGNVMGGLSVQLDKSIAAGDWITIGNQTGRVTEIRWRYTAIETRAWETVIIPNGMLVKSQVTILGRRTHQAQLWRRSVDFFVDFRTPPSDVIGAVGDALRSTPIQGVARDPAPHILMFAIKDSVAHYVVRYWLDELDFDDRTDGAIRVRLWYAMRRANIPMSIPAQAVFVTTETPEREERKQSVERERRMHAIGAVDLFRGLPDNLRQMLADHLVFAPFMRGEAITHEGDKDDGLYMIVDGTATVHITQNDEAREVAQLQAGQFFGEMSLMTGEARTATVIATSDMISYRIDKPAFEHVLRETPAIADQIAEVLAIRRSALNVARDAPEDVTHKRIQTAKQDLLTKIRSFLPHRRPCTLTRWSCGSGGSTTTIGQPGVDLDVGRSKRQRWGRRQTRRARRQTSGVRFVVDEGSDASMLRRWPPSPSTRSASSRAQAGRTTTRTRCAGSRRSLAAAGRFASRSRTRRTPTRCACGSRTSRRARPTSTSSKPRSCSSWSRRATTSRSSSPSAASRSMRRRRDGRRSSACSITRPDDRPRRSPPSSDTSRSRRPPRRVSRPSWTSRASSRCSMTGPGRERSPPSSTPPVPSIPRHGTSGTRCWAARPSRPATAPPRPRISSPRGSRTSPSARSPRIFGSPGC
ncbi:MAG: mechanosensitive ion channel family protein [Proteobacteria bacterium]|nr:mechanosensitive ion channel family protein [Pseudomonadota bacterium]